MAHRLIFAFVALAFLCRAAGADDRLIDQEPFDQIELDATNGKAVLKVFPLKTTNKNFPDPPELPPASGNLRVRLIDRPRRLYDCEWSHIVSVKRFEELIAAEANALVNKGEFNDAFDDYDYLLKNYPKLSGLNAAIDSFFYKHAAAAMKSNQHEEALTLLVELNDHNKKFTKLDKAVETVAARVITNRVQQGRYDAARGTIALVEAKFATVSLPRVDALKNALIDEATRLRDNARAQLTQGDLRKAQLASQRAIAIWPEAEGLRELKAEIDRKYPVVRIGVLQPAGPKSQHPLDDWASRRVSRLLRRPLIEMVSFSAEGGVYRSPLGALSRDESGLRWSLQIRPGITTDNGELLTGYEVSRKLLAAAGDAQQMDRAAWNSIFRGATVQDVYNVQMELARPHVRPDRLLEAADSATAMAEAFLQPYLMTTENGDNDFRANRRYFAYDASQPQEIIEHPFADPDDSIRAIRRGEIEVLDRVLPWDYGLLAGSEQVTVGRYQLPTVHVLIPNTKRALSGSRTLRRALLYGINRQMILDQSLLGGTPQEGSQVVSGPFAASAVINDPVGYATNDEIKPVGYEPRLAATLFAIGLKELHPDLPPTAPAPQQESPLILAHPADPIARLACLSMSEQWKLVGIQVELREFDPATSGPGDDYDLLYCELAAWEPVVDARRVLGEHGLTGGCSPYMSLALAKLDQANDWKEVRRRLREVHRIAADEMAILPLWQTVNYYAFRRGTVALGEQTVELYENIEQWKGNKALAVSDRSKN